MRTFPRQFFPLGDAMLSEGSSRRWLRFMVENRPGRLVKRAHKTFYLAQVSTVVETFSKPLFMQMKKRQITEKKEIVK